MSNLNMPVKYCTDENDEEFSPVVYQESMFNDDGTRMDPVPRKMFAKAYDPTKTYPTENLFCIQDNKYYRFTGSGTTTGTFDPTKWTETDDATELTTLNSTLAKKPSVNINNIITSGVDMVLITGMPTFTNGVTDIDISSYLPSGKKFSAVAFAVFQTAATISVKSCVVSTTTLTIKCDSSFSGQTAITAMLFTMPNT